MSSTLPPSSKGQAGASPGQTDWDGQQVFYHSTFDPGRYDAARANAVLAQMRHDGYNVVRVFMNDIAIGNPGGGLSSAYLANVVDFLNKAKAQGIFTQITLVFLPKAGDYYVPNQNPGHHDGIRMLGDDVGCSSAWPRMNTRRGPRRLQRPLAGW